MSFYLINDEKIIQKAKDILSTADFWHDTLNGLAKYYGFDKPVFRGRNVFHQYALAEFAVHESRLFSIDHSRFELVDRYTVSTDEASEDELAGIYHIYEPKDTVLKQEISDKIQEIGVFSPNKQLLPLICTDPALIKNVFYLDRLGHKSKVDLIYQTEKEVEDNHAYCEMVSNPTISEIVSKDAWLTPQYSHDKFYVFHSELKC